MTDIELVYLKTLAKQHPNIASASTEIINLQAILNLPKGTEHFLTDIHGEFEQFNHVLKNGSGSVRRKIDDEFGNTLSIKDKKSLATLIYYPKEKLDIIEAEEDNLEDWYKITLHRLVQPSEYPPNTPVPRCVRHFLRISHISLRSLSPRKRSFTIKKPTTTRLYIQS